MQDNQTESWSDVLFWGVTIAMTLMAVGAPLAVYFNWLPFTY